jgi:AcrR family transcriptional regulator
MPGSTAVRRRLNRDDWIRTSLEVLVNEGIGAVSVDRLAVELEVTRGSFYHHFKDRGALLDALLSHWSETLTHQIREQVASLQLDPATTLLALLRTIRRKRAAEYDAPFRAWALHDERAAKVLREVDRLRLEFCRAQFQAIGFEGIELESRARLFLYYETAAPAMFIDRSEEQTEALLLERHRFLVTR